MSGSGVSAGNGEAGMTCGIDGCDRPSRTRGMCKMHYLRWWKHGDPTAKKKRWGQMAEVCTVEGCDRSAEVKDLCRRHYSRVRANGDLDLHYRTGPKTDRPAYSTIHSRLRKEYGPASDHTCLCGEPASDWACLAPPVPGVPNIYSDRLDSYIPLCRRDHLALDMFRRNVVEQTGPSIITIHPHGVKEGA